MGEETDSVDAATQTFPIVGIGASAGGLEAMRLLFARMPDDTGMAFVVIQHLDPERPSMLSKVLAADVRMPVVEMTTDRRVEPNHVYVISPESDLIIHRRTLALVPRQHGRKPHLPIDTFFRSLATDLSERAIGVVLSGSASDGTEGLRAIEGAGGIALAQEPDSAQFRSMPESAIAAGVVDFRGSPEEIADELARLSRHAYLAEGPKDAGPDALAQGDDGSMASVFTAIQRHAHLDLRGYKRPTLMRRIARRMALRRVRTLEEYAGSLRDDPGESTALAEDILIHVTSFFRDPGMFEAVKQRVLPELLTHKSDEAPLRVWVPGCSTGEEAYSLGICLLEYLAEQHRDMPLKIFGSDVSERAIEAARAGLYSEADVERVGAERLARFFERVDGRYRIGKQLRELCVFVRHDLTKDPPFARLDIISCRNVLIYFDVDLQRRVLSLLHHCLNRPGYLLLGSSEGIREFDEIFLPVDKDYRIFLKTGESPKFTYPVASGRDPEAGDPVRGLMPPSRPAREAQRQADHVLLARYAPPGVVVNERLDVVQFRGRTGDFLESPPGHPQTNLLKMAREGLVGPLREALESARTQSVAVRRPGVRIAEDTHARVLTLEVVPLPGVAQGAERHFLVVFDERGERSSLAPGGAIAAQPPAGAELPPADAELARLRSELLATRDYLRALSAEHQDTAEELGAANEELIAANEELQSTNEELQSAKEELQSTNEELTTLNEELNRRNHQLDLLASDLVNVLESVQIPVIMVDEALRVRRFTPTAREISSLLPGDVGRSIDDVKFKIRITGLVDRIRETIDSVTAKEFEVQAEDGRWFRLHVRPYRTPDNRLDGAVLSFLDVDVLKRAVQEAELARDYANRIVQTVPVSLVVVDRELRVVSANGPFDRSFTGGTPSGNSGLFEIGEGALAIPRFREAIGRCLETHVSFRDIEAACALPGSGLRRLVMSGTPIHGASGAPMLLLAIDDVTERRLLEASEKAARIDAEQANRAKDLFLATLSHELRTPLSSMLMSAQVLQRVATDDPKVRRASAAIERAVGNQVRLIDDLLDISRIVSGKLMLDLQAVDLTSVTQSAVDVAKLSADAKGVALAVTLRGPFRAVHGDAARLQQVVNNLLNNAIKFTPRGGTVTVTLEEVEEAARLTVHDTGMGMRAEIIPHLFDRFMQGENALTRTHGGLGLGLAIVRHIVEVHGGRVSAESPGEGKGATFTVTLPLSAQAQEVATPATRTVTRSIATIRVLLVEDDDDTRAACAAMLEQQGAEVRAASSVADAFVTLEEFVPQVIICDIAMPGQDGYAFIRRLRREDGARSRIPAIALTALAGEDDRRRALDAGFQTHMAKPVDADRLATTVATWAAAPVPAPSGSPPVGPE